MFFSGCPFQLTLTEQPHFIAAFNQAEQEYFQKNISHVKCGKSERSCPFILQLFTHAVLMTAVLMLYPVGSWVPLAKKLIDRIITARLLCRHDALNNTTTQCNISIICLF